MFFVTALLFFSAASAAPVPEPTVEGRGLLGNGLLGTGLLNGGHALIGNGYGAPHGPTYGNGDGCILNGGQPGVMNNGLCVLSPLGVAARSESQQDGVPCQLVNGAPGVMQFGNCVRIPHSMNTRGGLLSINQGEPCAGQNGQGYWHDGICIPVLDGAIQIDQNNMNGHLLDGSDCITNGRYGYIRNKKCVSGGLLGLGLKKRSHPLIKGDGNLLHAGLDITSHGQHGKHGSLLHLRDMPNGYYDDDDLMAQLESAAVSERSSDEISEPRGLLGLGNGAGASGGGPLGLGLPGNLVSA